MTPSEPLHLSKLPPTSHEIEIYRYREDVSGVPVPFDVDLSKKTRQSIDVGK